MLIRNADSESGLHVDFVPMVDVLFNLLIFFLLATSLIQAEREMSIALPHARASGPISGALREYVINVNAEGHAIVAGRTLTDEELHDSVKTVIDANPDQKVSIRADRTTPYANVARVLDVCKKAGVAQPYLHTIPVP